ncbi:MAG: hypothetical protein V3T83_15255 [Acidobacteriota bacterium]
MRGIIPFKGRLTRQVDSQRPTQAGFDVQTFALQAEPVLPGNFREAHPHPCPGGHQQGLQRHGANSIAGGGLGKTDCNPYPVCSLDGLGRIGSGPRQLDLLLFVPQKSLRSAVRPHGGQTQVDFSQLPTGQKHRLVLARFIRVAFLANAQGQVNRPPAVRRRLIPGQHPQLAWRDFQAGQKVRGPAKRSAAGRAQSVHPVVELGPEPPRPQPDRLRIRRRPLQKKVFAGVQVIV